LLDSVNRESGIRMKAADVTVVRSPIQNDFAAMPVLCAKDNIFIVKRPQRANIMTRRLRKLDNKIISLGNGKSGFNRTNCVGTKDLHYYWGHNA